MEKKTKAERCKVNGPNVQNPDDLVRFWKPNVLTTELLLKTPKSERSDFGASLYLRSQGQHNISKHFQTYVKLTNITSKFVFEKGAVYNNATQFALTSEVYVIGPL